MTQNQLKNENATSWLS